MSTDWYTKLVLTVLAACAVLLVADRLPGDEDPTRLPDGRFRLQVLPPARLMLRIDSATGTVWRARYPDPTVWSEIAESPVDTLDDAPAPEEEDLEATREPMAPRARRAREAAEGEAPAQPTPEQPEGD